MSAATTLGGEPSKTKVAVPSLPPATGPTADLTRADDIRRNLDIAADDEGVGIVRTTAAVAVAGAAGSGALPVAAPVSMAVTTAVTASPGCGRNNPSIRLSSLMSNGERSSMASSHGSRPSGSGSSPTAPLAISSIVIARMRHKGDASMAEI
ncbi:hypothetical protein Vafri_14384 [Volvox africanus]|uniref:Uncharacterized protein n=1 Tax=Volvox africanus TaxID=51714 RepID=A0A8J4F4P9_9CHLO|nr:hypothetical protein Vafri_14384 [Volvox africanus]